MTGRPNVGPLFAVAGLVVMKPGDDRVSLPRASSGSVPPRPTRGITDVLLGLAAAVSWMLAAYLIFLVLAIYEHAADRRDGLHLSLKFVAVGAVAVVAIVLLRRTRSGRSAPK
jgi:hypothetical protein